MIQLSRKSRATISVRPPRPLDRWQGCGTSRTYDPNSTGTVILADQNIEDHGEIVLDASSASPIVVRSTANVQPRVRRLPIRCSADMTIHIRIRNATMASVIWTHRSKFPIVASMRSPQGYGRRSHAPSIIAVVVGFHQVSISGRYSLSSRS
jgi:hypothetical protein